MSTFPSLRIRHKLLLSYSLVFILAMSLGFAVLYSIVRKNIKANIESELKNTTTTILNLVKTSAAVSIKNYLRAIAEKNIEIVRYYFDQYKEGRLTEGAAKEMAANVLLSQTIGQSGYIYCLNSRGKVVVHPQGTLVNINVANYDFIKEMIRKKKGYMEYDWKNPGEKEPRLKLCIFNYIPEFDWIVGSSSYQEEFFKPLRTITTVIITIFVITLLLVLSLTYRICDSITRPLQDLRQYFEKASAGDFSLRMATTPADDEISQLSLYFNRFMAQMTEYSDNLKKQIQVRREVENTLRESEDRYRSVMEAAADPIIIYAMDGTVIYFNPAFSRVFGWTLSECRGRKMDHFVPKENWDETHWMINTILSGETVPATETRRSTKDGAVLQVSISGAVYRDRNKELAGSIIILRDITENKWLTRQLMDIGDQVRQTIGQDLHDDLCPHLIGIAGLTAVLEANLKKDSPEDSLLAGKIERLIEEATGKARNLARGLCPVHLVSHGLQSALKEIAITTEQMSGLVCGFSGDVDIDDNTVATHLYYIAHEAVNNAVKHAEAIHIDLSLLQKDGYIHLRITDDGQGISAGSVSDGIGMLIMRYRASVIGAFLEIETKPEIGTTVHVSLKGQV